MLNSDLPESLRRLLPEALHAACRNQSFARGERLFLMRHRPRNLYFVTRGEVVLERPGMQGDYIVLQRVSHGLLAEASLQSSNYHCDAVATVSGEAVALPLAPLRAALAEDASFALRWIGMLNAEVRRLRLQCERLSLKRVRQRLLHLIETEGGAAGLRVDAGIKSLATELAVTHEALYRTISSLEKAGTVRRNARRIVLKSRPRSA